VRDAERARQLAEAALKRNPKAATRSYAKSFALKGEALLGEGCTAPLATRASDYEYNSGMTRVQSSATGTTVE
jgi:hypothetical protein